MFDKVISGINNLKLTNARISLAIAISSKNYNRIQQIFDFAQILQIDILRLSVFIPVAKIEKNHEALSIPLNDLEI